MTARAIAWSREGEAGDVPPGSWKQGTPRGLIHTHREPGGRGQLFHCELLGLDPLYVANEGKLVAVVPADDADELLQAMRAHPSGRDATIIGRIVSDHPRMVTMKSMIGGERVVTMLAGEQLPRIC